MYNLTDEQINFILDDIKARGVTLVDLQHNLLDHVCCIIENDIGENQNFEEFYKNTIPRFFKSELKEIEEETNNLLTFKNYYAMKNTLKISGIISTILMMIGAIFKIMHWPGAAVMIVLSVVFFSLIFLPLLIILKLKDDDGKKNIALFTFGTFLGIISSIGVMFKIMHWPFANILMHTSMALFFFLYIPLYFFVNFRNPEKKFNTLINTVLMVAATGVLFSLVNLKGSNALNESLYDVHSFIQSNVNSTQLKNENLYAILQPLDSNLEISNAIDFSEKLNVEIENIKFYLIAESENISEDEAKKIDLETISSSKNSKIVNQFAHGALKYSKADLKKSILSYNNSKIGIQNPINLEVLKLENTILPVLLHQLTQIQGQIVTNENIYLNFIKGKMMKS